MPSLFARFILVILGVTVCLSAPSAIAVASHEDPTVAAINICEELGFDPCPPELESVLPTSVEAKPVNGCEVSYQIWGPGVTSVYDPNFGYVQYRYLVLGTGITCNNRKDLVAIAGSVPTTNPTGGSTLYDVEPCLSATSCFATGGWGWVIATSSRRI